VKKYVLVIGCLWMLTLAAAAQVNNYYVNTSTGSDSNNGTSASPCGAGCGPWKTWAQANTAARLGTAGATVHFADGTYVGSTSNSCGGLNNAAFCITHGGTATQPLIFQCDNGLNGNAGHPGVPGHCLLRESSDVNNDELIGSVGTNYTTIQGFDIGGDGSHPATQVQSGWTIYAKDGTGLFMNGSYNYLHDMTMGAPASNNPNGEGPGCPPTGAIEYDGAYPVAPGRNGTDGTFIGNWINNVGLVTNTACNEFHGMYVGNGPRMRVQNNIVGNVPGSGIKIYGSNCSSVVTNNLVYHTGWWGILVRDTGNGACQAQGAAVGLSTISNNQIVNTGFNKNCGAIAEGSGSGTNLYANNLLIGNQSGQNVPVANCSTTPIPSPSIVTGNLNTANSGATTANTFVNYLDNGTGDYHLKAGSVAIGAGSTACVSGGISPCIPATYFAGFVRPSRPSIGTDELGTSATQSPDAPTNLSAIVQ
jgi:hypothetical protein